MVNLRKSFKKVSIFIVLAIVGILSANILKRIGQKNTVNNLITNLPNIPLLSLHQKNWYTKSLNSSLPIFIIYFNPKCDHCQYQISLAEEIVKKKEVKVIAITNANVSELKEFMKKNNYEDSENFFFLSDEKNEFPKLFGTNVFPSIFIYGKDKKLKKRFNGETKAEAILKYLD